MLGDPNSQGIEYCLKYPMNFKNRVWVDRGQRIDFRRTHFCYGLGSRSK